MTIGVDDELRSNEELYSGTFAQLMTIGCSVAAEEEQTESASLFEAACAEKIQQFDDSESDEEVSVCVCVCVCVCVRACVRARARVYTVPVKKKLKYRTVAVPYLRRT